MPTDVSPTAILARIKGLLDARGMSARAAGQAAGAVHIIPNLSKGSAPSIDNLAKLADVLGTSPSYLAFGIEEGPSGSSRPAALPPIATVPIVGEVAAGRWLVQDDPVDESPYHGIAVPPDPAYPIAHQFAAISKGTSINRVAPDGSILGCVDVTAARLQPKNGDLVIVERTRDGGHTRERTAKRYQRTKFGYELWPDSDDPRWSAPIQIVTDEEDEATTVAILGIVTWIHRPLDRSERRSVE